MKKQNEIIFYCDNCSAPRLSKKHITRFTNDDKEISIDTCEVCETTQEIEFNSDDKHIDKFRIKNEREK